MAEPEGTIGAIAPLKPAKVAFFTIILYNSENNIRNIEPLCCPLFCTVAKLFYETWLPNITKIAPPPNLTGWIRPCLEHCSHGRSQKFFQGRATWTFCLSFSSCWRCNANRRSQNALLFPHHKENSRLTATVTKMPFVVSNSQVYYDNLYNRLPADFQYRALLFN